MVSPPLPSPLSSLCSSITFEKLLIIFQKKVKQKRRNADKIETYKNDEKSKKDKLFLKAYYDGRLLVGSNKVKGRISKRVFQESKVRTKFPKKQTFLTPLYAHVRVRIRGKKCLFFGNFGVLCFLETPVLRFALLPYYRRCIGLIRQS